MEASNPQPGSKTVLNSPYFHSSGPECTFRFWYHMYGANVDKIELAITHDTERVWRSPYDTLWSMQGMFTFSWSMQGMFTFS